LDERPLHPEQSITAFENEGGRLMLNVKVMDHSELHHWLQAQGADIEVLEPQDLRERMQQKAEAMLAQYK